ncbi:Glycosyltransferase [Rhynchospora pubera]|uniref:Glycosyltransferase n=1 Tax=Rhynchospora pubera TaxID=906938 RepID=A0AAV8FAE4_9POAL|nr:Glycosyltransferase [Rhynchospora pubera]
MNNFNLRMQRQQLKLSVLMLPWLAHGHANRYLELAKRLTRQLSNLSIHFCSTPVILNSLRNDDALQHSTRISLVEFRLTVTVTEQAQVLPSHWHTTKHLPPHLLPTLIRAFAESEQTLVHLLDTLKPDLIIFDIFQPWAAKLARQRNIPTAVYIGCTVAMSLSTHDYFQPSKEFPFSAIKLTQDNRRQRSSPAEDQQGYRHFLEQIALCWQLSDFVIARSFCEIELKYINYFSTLIGKEVVLTGPLIPDVRISTSPAISREAEKVMHWLEQRERRSVVFVSFGSECFMPYKEMEQLAHGLELSGTSFIWVARFPEKAKMGGEEEEEEEEASAARALLHGLAERVGPQKGLVVTSWAPQRQILVHGNLGCFLTHCGWSSVIEGMEAGVPMLALPMDWDQPANAKLIVELGVGIEIPQHGLGNFKAEDVAACVKQILQSEHGVGQKVRRNAEDLAGVIRNRHDDDIRILADKIVAVVEGPKSDRAIINI